MAWYFFDCFDGKQFQPDMHGIELFDLDEVADQGACLARELLRETIEDVGALGISVMVRNTDGIQVYAAHCSFHASRMPEAGQEGSI